MIEAFERILGQIEQGFKVGTEDNGPIFQITRSIFPKDSTLRVYSTLGLYHYDLSIGDGKHVNAEFLILLDASIEYQPIIWALQDIGKEALQRGECPLNGDVIKLGGSLIPGYDFTAVFAATPLFLDDDQHIVPRDAQKYILLIWLIPITGEEAQFAKDQGISALEDLMESDLPSLLRLPRTSFV